MHEPDVFRRHLETKLTSDDLPVVLRIDPTSVYAAVEADHGDVLFEFSTKDGQPAALLDGDWYVGDYDGTPIEDGDDGTWLDVTPDDMDGFLPGGWCDDDGIVLVDADVLERAVRDVVEDELEYYRLADSDDKRYEYRIETL
ncbi:hypothetical protein ACLUWO_08060 [Pseudoscardovia radai]|uniref:hypothetical protein n=1 Tax=Pseudoscardovia radai TaxID=987066 RepID=UPI003994CD9B